MAVITTLDKISYKINLDFGTTAQGNVVTKAISLSGISTTGYTAEKAYNIAAAIRPLLNHTIYSQSEVKTSDVEEE